ncbi:MAG: dihydroneopterin aldolase [Terrisporobacter sp.]|uniref:dihydroneopterin aldolase n=1 Tax=Terrisporobacter sp. TaxID=1965305 RepID=UPI002FC650F4
MDKIILSNLGFYGYHGVLEAEKVLGQKFFIDIELFLDTKEAGKTDDMNKSVSYAEVYDVARDIAENERFDLIEALAENIACKVLNKFSLINSIMVRVKKPEAPVNGIYDYFAVEIRRDRNE